MPKNWVSLVVSIGLAAIVPDVRAGELPELFIAIEPDPEPSPPDGRYRETFTVALNMEALKEPAHRIMLNLPGREQEVVELQHWQPRRGYIQILDPEDPSGQNTITIPDPSARPEDFWWRWYGKSAHYTVALTTVDGIVAGRISSGLHRYAVEPFKAPSIQLGLINSDFWQTHPSDGEGGERARADTAHPTQAGPAAAALSTRDRGWPGDWDPSCPGSPPDGQYVIDVLLFYTQGILDRYFGNTSSVHAGLQSALDDANQALRNGGIQNVTFSPRGPELLPNPGIDFIYDEAPIVQALHRLAGVATAPPPVFYTFPGNVYVAARRDAMWADIVALARDDLSGQQTCGYSVVNRWVANNDYPREPGPDFEKFAYLVFDPGCGADRLNLAHELGHQLGMEHDPANYWAPGSLPSCPWSFAHKRSAGDPRFRFRTVTAYWQNIGHRPGPGDCGSDSNCPLIDSFSTPLLEWAGDPASGGPPPFGLQPVGTVSGAWPIGIASASHPNRPAHGVDTLRRIAPFAQDYRARPELIFANGFQ